jgi:UDPglucose 6-dehydrogenase
METESRTISPIERDKRIENISVVGLGKLGLCIAACLANKGYHVFGIDIDPSKVHLINKGVTPTYEPGLAEMLKSCRERLTATGDYRGAIETSDVTFVIVNTPSNSEGSYSVEKLTSASEEIGRAIKDKNSFHVVALTSTVLPGTTNNVVKSILEETSEKECRIGFGLCYNPEFIALGSVIRDFLNPDFVLIGESDPKSGELLSGIYRKICENNPRIARMNIVNAELTKIALNSYVTMKISFANTLAEICERLPGGNVDVVTSALGLDQRIGPKYIKGGLGFGGPCFPRDNKAFSFFAKQLGCNAKLAEASDLVNEKQVKRIAEIVEKEVKSDGRIAILGLTYKPDTNIVEASQALDIAQTLAERGHSVKVYDPLGIGNAKELLDDKVEASKSSQDCLKDAQICIIATPWNEFKKLSPEDFTKCGPIVIIDCWRILNRDSFEKKVKYIGIGLGQEDKRQKRNG